VRGGQRFHRRGRESAARDLFSAGISNLANQVPAHKTRRPMKNLLALAVLAMLATSALAADGPIRHVVHFKFKKDATPEQIAKITTEFAALKTKIDVVESLEWGTNLSPEGLDKGYTHCWLVSFKNAKDRDAYLVHPAHTAFVAILKPILDEALVVDFIPQK
jgi:hypothetical protein